MTAAARRIVTDTPGAERKRRARARERAGIRSLRIVTHYKRLKAALRAQGMRDDELADHAKVEAALADIVDEWVRRWIGPPRK